MGLITNPQIVNDGAARSFELVGTYKEGVTTVGEYLETAAAQSLNSRLFVKHTRNNKLVRSLAKATYKGTCSDGTTDDIIANFTIAYNPKHAQADVEMIIKRLSAMTALATFPAGFALGRV